MAINKIEEVKRLEKLGKVCMRIDNDVKIILSDNAKNKFTTYLKSIITSVERYAGEENKKEYARFSPRNNAFYNECLSCTVNIEMIGCKDEDYILIKFTLICTSKCITAPSKCVYISTADARQLLKDLDI